jgi:hypothetical protein
VAYQKCTVLTPIGLSHAVLNQLAFAAPCASEEVPWKRRPARAVLRANADWNWALEALLRIGRAVRKRVAIVTECGSKDASINLIVIRRREGKASIKAGAVKLQ